MSSQQPEQQDWRTEEFKYDQFFFQITFGVMVIVVAVLIGFALFPDDMGYRSNLYTTALGVLITVSLLDLLARRRDERRTEKELKARLIRDFCSSVPEVARRAAEELNAYTWLQDGSLKDKNLGAVQLPRAYLVAANMQKSQFGNASFQGANLMLADLEGANLILSDLSYSNLMVAKLQKTIPGLTQIALE